MDSLVIPGRTRYPSDRQFEEDKPPTIDRNIARTLLSLDGQLHSRHLSAQSSVPTAASFGRNPTSFVQKYNDLARTYALSELNALSEPYYEKIQISAETPKPPPSGKRGLWRKLVRSASSHNLPEPPRLVRKTSLSNLLGRQAKLSLNCQSLDEFSHYGGVSVLTLPAPYRAFNLEIPTCLAATGNYLAKHGKETAGIFRIPGQVSVVTALHQYYTSQIHEACQTREQIHASIGSPNLPVDIICGIHDVGSTFKKFLWDLPGGILGSVELFRALQNVQSSSCDTDIKARLCALAILSLISSRRIAIICAVFGLLALIKHDPDQLNTSPVTPTRHLGPESMSSRSLSLIFAPTLLGNLSEHIVLGASASHNTHAELHLNAESNRRMFKNAFRTPRHRKSNSADRPPEMDVSIQRNSVAADITEMLIRGWESIAKYTRLLEPALDSRRTSQSSSNLVQLISKTKSNNNMEGWMASRSSSDATSQNYLQIPVVGRSVSLIEMPQPPQNQAMQENLPVIEKPSQQDAFIRYPKLISGATYQGHLKTGSHETSDEGIPWWSRKLNHALKDTSKLNIVQDDTSRIASDSTTLFTPTGGGLQPLGSAESSVKIPALFSWDDEAREIFGSNSKGFNPAAGKELTDSSPLDTKTAIDQSEQNCFVAKTEHVSDSLSPMMDSGIEMSSYQDINIPIKAMKHDHDVPSCQPVPSVYESASRFSRRTSLSQSSARSRLPESQDGSNLTTKSYSSRGAVIDSTGSRLQPAIRSNEHDRRDNLAYLNMSPSLIPRPVTEHGRGRSIVTGSPRAKAFQKGMRQSFLHSSNNSMPLVEPLQNRMQIGTPDLKTLRSVRHQSQEHLTKSEPPARLHCMPSLRHQGLRRDPVSRQINLGTNATGKLDNMNAQYIRHGHCGRQPNHCHPINVGTLYAEIRTLSERLNRAKREIAEWRHRAERAEAILQGSRENGQHAQSYQY